MSFVQAEIRRIELEPAGLAFGDLEGDTSDPFISSKIHGILQEGKLRVF
jgi:hypothetical protein